MENIDSTSNIEAELHGGPKHGSTYAVPAGTMFIPMEGFDARTGEITSSGYRYVKGTLGQYEWTGYTKRDKLV